MSFINENIYDFLGSFWNKFEDKDVVLAYWDAISRSVISLRNDYIQIDGGKSVKFVKVDFLNSSIPLVFDSSTEVPVNVEDAVKAFTIPTSPGSEIVLLPTIRTKVEGGSSLLSSSDYEVNSNIINLVSEPSEKFFFADFDTENRNSVFNNFGSIIDFFRTNSERYKKSVQALFFALFNGPSIANIRVGMNVLLDLPFSRGGIVGSIESLPGQDTTVTVDGISFDIPFYGNPSVSVGEDLRDFQELSDVVRVNDVYNNSSFFDVDASSLVSPLQKFHTFFVVIPIIHLEISGQSTNGVIDLSEPLFFLERIHPEYTDYKLLVEVETGEDLGFVNPVDMDLILSPCNITSSYVNWSTISAFGAEPLNDVGGFSFTFTNYEANPSTFSNFHLDNCTTVAMDDSLLEIVDDSFDLTPSVDQGTFNYVNFFNQPGFKYETANNITFQEYSDVTS